MKDYKNYKRFPIQLSQQSIIMIHLFNDINTGSAIVNTMESIDMTEENQACAEYDVHREAAKQFFSQLEGHYCDYFLAELIVEATRMLAKSDSKSKEPNRVKKVIDRVSKIQHEQ